MATTPRGGRAYVWVTWLTGILAGDKECVFALWFKAHFRYEKVPDANFNLAAWNADHSALVAEQKQLLEAQGWAVTVEGENQFRLYGKTAVLAGKPDLLGRKPGRAIVVDCKTGAERRSDWWQVLTYLLALPRCFTDLADVRLEGLVCYRDRHIAIQAEELNAERRNDIYTLLQRLGAEDRPPAKPSARECAYCDISLVDCAARVSVIDEDVAAMATEF